MLEKIKNHQPKLVALFNAAQDMRTLGALAFLVIALLISWSGVKVIETNYNLQKDIAKLKQENAVHELENRNLDLQNQYYKSNEYLELEARKNFGLAAPGETVIVVPKSVAMRHVTETAQKQAENPTSNVKTESNFEAWMDFLFHRTPN
jgi:cell division protein FtsB